jgi:nudix-type nucleoside diphosphatase (YffH/AdpP family)
LTPIDDRQGGENAVAKPEILGVKTLYEGWGKFQKLMIRTAGGAMMEREVEDHGSAAAVLPFDRERRTAVLVRQFRPPVLHAGGPPQLLEAVAGILDEDDPAACARREAEEEVGLKLRRIDPVGTVWSSPGISTERIHLFLAPYTPADRVSDGGGLDSEHEEIEVVELPLEEAWALLERGEITDLKTFALLQALRLREPRLFG